MIIALVTGGNVGIGEAVVRQLAKTSGFHVIIGSRNAGSNLVSDGFICKAVEQINDKYGKLDVLVNNAGILINLSPDAFTSTRDLFRTTLETNVFGTAVLPEAALPLLLQAEYPRIIFVSSLMGSLEASLDESAPFYYTDYKVYDASKAAVNILAVNYARLLKDVGGASNAVCLGLVKTKLTGYHDYGTPVEVGAERIIELATSGPG